MLKACLHLHTSEDPDDLIGYTAKEAIDYSAKLNFDVLAITCHNSVIYNDELNNYAHRKNILLIPGIEKNIAGKKHVLILNADQDAEKINTFVDLKKIKPSKNYFIIAPHPFFIHPECLGKLLYEHIDVFDGIEMSYFYTSFLNLNKKAILAAQKFNKPLIGTSDVHLLKYFDYTYTLINAEKNIPAVLHALRNNQLKIVTKPLSVFQLITILPEAELIALKLASVKKYYQSKFNKP